MTKVLVREKGMSHMGLFSKFLPQPKAAQPVALPYAEPGIKAIGSHYFEENIGKVPTGKPALQVVAAPEADWGKVQVLWSGLRIGHLGLDEKQERTLLKVLLQMAPAGTVFSAAGETIEEHAVDLNAPESKLATRTRVRLMIPSPEKLERWHKTPPAERSGLQLSEPKTVQVRLKGQGTVQEALENLSAGKDEYRCKATISVGTEVSGKYKGAPSLTFSVKGQVVGVVGGRYQAEEPELFDGVLQGGISSVQLSIRRSSFGGNALYATAEIPVG